MNDLILGSFLNELEKIAVADDRLPQLKEPTSLGSRTGRRGRKSLRESGKKTHEAKGGPVTRMPRGQHALRPLPMGPSRYAIDKQPYLPEEDIFPGRPNRYPYVRSSKAEFLRESGKKTQATIPRGGRGRRKPTRRALEERARMRKVFANLGEKDYILSAARAPLFWKRKIR